MPAARRPARILVVDDDRNVRELVLDVLRDAGHTAAGAAGGAEALSFLARDPVDLVLLDLDLPGTPGAELLPRIRAGDGPPAVVILTADRRLESAIAMMRGGAEDYLVKPVEEEGLLHRIDRVLESRTLRSEVARLRDPAPLDGARYGIVGASPLLRSVLARVALVARTEMTVLVTGESGTGKELVARAIHAESPRAGGPFVATNAGALPGGLLEPALFGHVRGAFTGAVKDARGLFEEARGGTLFLDEIGEVSADVQVKLLRAVEARTVRPVGADRDVVTDVRLVVATNRDLKAELAAGRFRPDLYYRVSVFPVDMPPLRDRRGDVPLLARYVAERFAKDLGRPTPALSAEVLGMLAELSWPGNVRQLENVIKEAIILAAGGDVGPEHLRTLASGGAVPDEPARAAPPDIGPFAEAKVAFERSYLTALLESCEGNVVRASQQSGMDRKEIYSRVRKYGIDLGAYRTHSY